MCSFFVFQIKESYGKGKGVFATKDILDKEFICEYHGELLSSKEGNLRFVSEKIFDLCFHGHEWFFCRI
jgi:hypothetical protein